MALVTCPDCSRDVSSGAANCPHCGRPMAVFSAGAVQTRRKGGKFEGIGFLLILGGIAACFADGALGAITILVGFVVFLIGRFM